MTEETMGLAGSDRSQWDAALHLVFDRVDGQTKLSERAHEGPLYVQNLFILRVKSTRMFTSFILQEE